MHSTIQGIFEFEYKRMSGEHNSDLFPIFCGHFVVVVCIILVGTSHMTVSNWYSWVIEIGRIPYSDFESKYYNVVALFFTLNDVNIGGWSEWSNVVQSRDNWSRPQVSISVETSQTVKVGSQAFTSRHVRSIILCEWRPKLMLVRILSRFRNDRPTEKSVS